MQHHGGAGRARGRERAPAEQGVDVVDVDQIGAEPLNGGGDLLGIDASAGQRPGGLNASQVGAGALQQLTAWPWRDSISTRFDDRALLAAGRAIAVVEHQDAHRQLTLTDESCRPSVILRSL